MLRDEIELVSPESFLLRLEVAGLGSRFLAILTDTIIQSILILLIFIGGAGTIHLTLEALKEHALSWVGAVVFLLIFLVTWGYFVLFESLWDGQSPGKRLLGLRVSKVNGQPLTFFDSVVRNLVRYVDFFPFLYGLGAAVALCNRHYRRVGDYAAGTVVLRVRSPELSLDIMPRGAPSPSQTSAPIAGGEPLTPCSPSAANAFARHEVAVVTQRDYEILRGFLLRRGELDQESRQRLADRIASGLRARMSIADSDVRWRTTEEFLESLGEVARAFNLRS